MDYSNKRKSGKYRRQPTNQQQPHPIPRYQKLTNFRQNHTYNQGLHQNNEIFKKAEKKTDEYSSHPSIPEKSTATSPMLPEESPKPDLRRRITLDEYRERKLLKTIKDTKDMIKPRREKVIIKGPECKPLSAQEMLDSVIVQLKSLAESRERKQKEEEQSNQKS